MRRGRVDARVARFAAHRHEAALEAELRRHAAALGVPVAELRAEAEEVARRCRAAGASTLDACVALVAQDLGLTPEELRAEVWRMPGALCAGA